jgi:DNA-binding NtrC family response regulator
MPPADDRVNTPDQAPEAEAHSVLLASPDTDAARALADTLRKARIGFVQAKTAAHALSCLDDGEFAVVIAGGARDPRQKHGLWERLNELASDVPVVGLLEGEQRPDNSALGANAFDYIRRPFDEDVTLDTVQRALQAARETQSRPPTVALPALNEVLVRSPAMRATMSLVERAAPSDGDDPRRKRHRQGSGRAPVARAERASEGPADQGALRRAARADPRE